MRPYRGKQHRLCRRAKWRPRTLYHQYSVAERDAGRPGRHGRLGRRCHKRRVIIMPLPTILGGACVTLNNQPSPLLMNSAGQINAQIPPPDNIGSWCGHWIKNRLPALKTSPWRSTLRPSSPTGPQRWLPFTIRTDGPLRLANLRCTTGTVELFFGDPRIQGSRYHSGLERVDWSSWSSSRWIGAA